MLRASIMTLRTLMVLLVLYQTSRSLERTNE